MTMIPCAPLARCALLACTLAAAASANAAETFRKDTVLREASEFLGKGAAGIGEVIGQLFEDLGEPNAYIKGEEASAALAVGARYGSGTLVMRAGGTRRVHWTGPSIGFDAGGNLARVFVLVYGLRRADAIFQRFPAVDGSLFVVGGISASYHRSASVIVAPIRLGAGLRSGINVGYIKYTRTKTWNPF